MYQKASSGAGGEQVLLKSPLLKYPGDWSRDGRFLIYEQIDPKTKNDIWILPLSGDQKPFPYLQSQFTERWPKLSPDGRWLAYTSDETGRNEVYVQTFPAPGSKYQVSANGGGRPVWSRDGKELFYLAEDRKLMAVEVTTGSRFEAGAPKSLFEVRTGPTSRYDVSPDGRRFLVISAQDAASAQPMTVVVNWHAGVKK